MKTRNIEDKLALAGAIIVLVGVSFAGSSALAEEHTDLTTTALAIHNAADGTLDGAARANEETAAAAAASLALENWIDLDIRLDDRTSTLMARGN